MIVSRQINRQQKVQTVSVPAPVGGLNGRDALANMPATDAVILDNFFPQPASVGVRNGSLAWATGLPSAVNSLCGYSSATTGRKLFAASGGGIYDVTAKAAVGAAAVSGLTSDKWQHTNFGANGGQYLYMVNGADSPQLYSGSAWQAVTGVSAPIAITGVTTSLLVHVNSWKGRLFFVENNSMRAWYLPLGSVGGAAQSLDMSQFCKLGGYLMAMFTWTVDNSGGTDELAVFLTSEGELLVFRGTDPSYASSWFLQAVFRVGRPIGRRCFVRIGADVAILSADGLYPISQAMLTDRSQRQDAVSDKIVNLINTDVQSYAANFGWQAILSPIGNKLVINVPATGGTYQYVMNTVTGAWCRFTGWAANCFELMGDSLFFGAASKVYQCDTGLTDDGAAINVVALQAFQNFGTPSQKQFTLGRPILTSNAAFRPAFSIQTDYNTTPPKLRANFSVSKFTPWNSPWGSPWSSPTLIRKDWQSVGGIGFTGAPALAFASKNAVVSWQSTDICFTSGDPL